MTAAPDPLVGLESVEWGDLHHAYGPAVDVPGQLRALLSADDAIRAKAHYQLRGNIYHQGSRWEASAHAVPWLVALADNPTTPDRLLVVGLLRLVGIGDLTDEALPFDPEQAFPAVDDTTLERIEELMPAFYDEGLDNDDDLEVIDAAASLWEAAAFHAMAPHTATFRRWLADPDIEVASRAAELLAWLPATSAAIIDLLAVPVDEDRPTVRASANLVLGYLPVSSGDIDARLLEQLHSVTPLVQLSAAVALAQRMREHLPVEAREALAAAATVGNGEIPGWQRPLQGFIALAQRRSESGAPLRP